MEEEMIMRNPSAWSATQPQCSRPVSRLGEHSVEVLREIGYSDDRIDALMRSGATATERRTEKET